MELKQLTRCCFLAILFLLVSKKASTANTVKSIRLCGVGWTYSDVTNVCYQAVLGQPKTWPDARRYCQQIGGDLLSISNVDEQDFVQGMLNNTNPKPHSYWIGATDEALSGVWQWTDGTPFSYTNWWPGEPNNAPNEDCVEMVVPWNYQWNDVFCDTDTKVFICKKNDVDECAAGEDNCDVNAQCTNTVGSFTCACNTGYTGNGVTCTDEDECAAGTDNCDANAACTNTVGSFTCVCNTGFNGNGITCTDVDECTAGTDNCDVNAQCTNTAGSFTCACIAGYSGNGVTCTDIDECTTGTDNCDVHATCTNTVGSFTCTCNPGYTGNGVTCTDVDECASIPCLNGGQCINGQNMFTCVCSSGWTGTTCQTGFVCNPDNTIDVSNLPANYSYFAMQNVTSGSDVECTVTPTSSTSVKISGCLKDLDILLTYSTYNGMSPNVLHGGKFLTAVLVKCSEIPDNGTVHNVNNTFEAALIISDDTYVAPTYSVDSFLSTNSTFVGSDVTWTITLPEEYILQVTSCTAHPGTDDSSSKNVSLISDGGCTITDELISNFTDHGNGSVTATILAFKFYNNDYVFLRCDLKVCPNYSSACDTQCSRMKRSLSKRSVNERAAREPEDYYNRKVNTVLRVMEPGMLSGSTQLSPLNQSKSFAFAILLILLSTPK